MKRELLVPRVERYTQIFALSNRIRVVVVDMGDVRVDVHVGRGNDDPFSCRYFPVTDEAADSFAPPHHRASGANKNSTRKNAGSLFTATLLAFDFRRANR